MNTQRVIIKMQVKKIDYIPEAYDIIATTVGF